jgi:hypothetical protein
MAEDLSTYLPGDTVIFSVELVHDINIGDAWAVFLRREQEAEANQFPLSLEAAEIEELRRVDSEILSRVTFQAKLTKRNHIPGEFDLEKIRVLPPGQKRSQHTIGIEVDAGSEVSFRVAQEPAEPSLSVAYWELRRHNKGTRDIGYEREYEKD